MKILTDLVKAAALATLGFSKHRGHDLWLDMQFFHQRLMRSTDSILVDVGANIGQTAIPMAKAFPACRILSFEPCSTTFAELQKNTSSFSNIHLVNCALGDVQEERTMYLKADSPTNSLIYNQVGECREERVTVTTFNAFAETHGIKHVFLLKTDTEGFDLSVLKGASLLLEQKRVDYLLVETCFYRKMELLPQTDFGEVSAYLAHFDYHFVHMYETVYATSGGQALWSNSLFSCR